MNKKGFSLIEVMVTLLILSFGMLGIAALMTLSTKTAAASAHTEEAFRIAQGQLESLEATGYNGISSGSANVTGSSGVAYSVNWTATVVGQVKQVSLSVQWSDSAVSKHAFTLNAQFSQ